MKARVSLDELMTMLEEAKAQWLAGMPEGSVVEVELEVAEGQLVLPATSPVIAMVLDWIETAK